MAEKTDTVSSVLSLIQLEKADSPDFVDICRFFSQKLLENRLLLLDTKSLNYYNVTIRYMEKVFLNTRRIVGIPE